MFRFILNAEARYQSGLVRAQIKARREREQREREVRALEKIAAAVTSAGTEPK